MSLAGKKIVVTRPKHQADGFVSKLQQHGAEAMMLPAIELHPPKDREPLHNALRDLQSFDWVIFTSVNGVEAVKRAIQHEGIAPETLSERKLAAIGPATAKALTESFRKPDIVPEDYISDVIPDAIGAVAGKKILLPRANIARKELRDILTERGAHVVDVAAYEITENCTEQLVTFLQSCTEEERPDYLTLTSSSTARGLHSILKAADKLSWASEIPVASIGPITAKTAKELGMNTDIIATDYTTDGLLEAIMKWEEKR